MKEIPEVKSHREYSHEESLETSLAPVPEFSTRDRHKVFISIFACRCFRCSKPIPAEEFYALQDREQWCLACADLLDLVFLHTGDANVTKKAKSRSRRYAYVHEMTRFRLERVGCLVEMEAIRAVQAEDPHLEGPFFQSRRYRWQF